jgi:hypothetical protein
MTPEERQALIARFRAERIAAGLPEYIVSERLHRIFAHVIATNAARTRSGPGGGSRGRASDLPDAIEIDHGQGS